MPRVTFVKSARKDNPVAKKGESYYWWKFRFGGKRFSLTYPKRSQLTQSAYFGTLYDLADMIEDYEIVPGEMDTVESLRDEVEGELDSLRDECQESLDNMPEALQYAPTGELLQERIDALENAINELGYIEAPDQWEDEQERIDAREQWIEDEPVPEDFEDEKEFDEAKEKWFDEEPDEPEGFDDFEKFEIQGFVEECIV